MEPAAVEENATIQEAYASEVVGPATTTRKVEPAHVSAIDMSIESIMQ